jgi:tetratricopeptide (TPR) repeat protein
MNGRVQPSLALAIALSASACGGAAVQMPADVPAAEAEAPPPAPTIDPVVAAAGSPVDVADTRGLEALDAAVDRYADGDLAGARDALSALLSDPVVGARAAYNLGTIAFAEQQEDQALAYFEAAMQADPMLAEPVAATVRILLRSGDRLGARRVVDEQLRASEEAPQIAAVALLVTLVEGRHEQVIRDGRALLLRDEDNLDIFYAMGAANLALGRTELARYIFQQGNDRDGERPEFLFGLAEIEIAANNNPGARALLRRLLDVAPYHAEAWNNLGALQLETRAFEEAVESFEAATRCAPSYREAWLNLGNAYKGAQRYSDAIAAFETALSLDRTYADPYFNLGVLYLDTELPTLTRLQRFEQSIAYFGQYRDRAGTLPDGHPYFDFVAQAERMYATQLELDSAPPPPEPSDEDSGDEGGGDDWGDDWGDFGDDSGAGETGDDSGGDDGGGDDGGGDDGGGDDGGDDEWGDEWDWE